MFFKKKITLRTIALDECKKLNINVSPYINKKTPTLQIIQTKLAIIDELSPKQIKEIATMPFDDDLELIKKRESFLTQPDLEYYIQHFKPKTIKNKKTNTNQLYSLKGTILGDLIGQPYEFTHHEPIKQLYKNSAFFTDDTVLSAATFEAIKENKTEPDFRGKYLEFYNKYPRAGYGSNFVRWAMGVDIDNHIGYGSYADGSAMRISYIGAYYDDVKDVIKHTFNSAICTHNHIDAVKGAIVTSVIIWMCYHGYNKEEIKDYAYKHYAYDEEILKLKTTGKIHFNLTDPEKNKYEFLGNISCNFAVPYAIYCFLETESYEQCMFKVLEHFCDADTICAIAGGIAAAYYNELDEDTLKNKLKVIMPSIYSLFY